jgi:hypothetical protein
VSDSLVGYIVIIAVSLLSRVGLYEFIEALGGVYGEGKVIPLHAMEARGVRGGIAPTHS